MVKTPRGVCSISYHQQIPRSLPNKSPPSRLFTSFLHLLWMPLVLKQRIRNSNSWKLLQALVKTIDLHKIPKLPILHYTLHIYWEKWLVSSPNNFIAIRQKDLNPTTLRAALNHWLHTFRDLKFDGKPSRNRDFRLCSVFHGVKQHSLRLLLWRRCQTTSSRGGNYLLRAGICTFISRWLVLRPLKRKGCEACWLILIGFRSKGSFVPSEFCWWTLRTCTYVYIYIYTGMYIYIYIDIQQYIYIYTYVQDILAYIHINSND